MLADQSTAIKLAGRLSDFYDTLGEYERHSLHLLTSVALGGIAPQGDVPAEGNRKLVWQAGVKLLSHINPAGLAFVGQVDFIVKDYLSHLKAEAIDQYGAAHRTGPQELSPGGVQAVELAGDPRLHALVEKHIGFPVTATLISSYLYYVAEGDFLYPHVDTEAFAINCILLIDHRHAARRDRKSALVVWDTEANKRRIELDPGEMAILHASGTVHAREAVVAGETVTMLTIGFQKAGTIGQ